MIASPPAAPRRFYAAVDVAPAAKGWTVRLDARALVTPAKAQLAVPTRALAEAIAGEWAAQGETIRAETMPITRLANVAIDRAPHTRPALIAATARYAETDLLCHRAPGPAGLVARQAAAWDPFLAWADVALGVRLTATDQTLAVAQPAESLAALTDALTALDDFQLTTLAHGAGLTGSVVLAAALVLGGSDAGAVFDAAFLDDTWQIEIWGADEEAVARGGALRAEVQALAAVAEALTKP